MSVGPILELRKFNSPEFVLGTGASLLAASYAARFGARKIFIVTDPGIIGIGHVEVLLRSLREKSLDFFVFYHVSPNPRDFEVREGCARYLGEKCDVIIALGGGSVIDAAKGIGLMATNDRDVLDFEGVDKVPLPGPPLICIPTTAGTAADVSQAAVISASERKVKIICISRKAIPDIALIDPELCVTMPPELTAATGMDVLTHALEAYVSTASSPVTDMHAAKAIGLVAEFLPRAVQDGSDREARSGMTLASLLAGLAFSNASLGAVHAMAHSLGGNLDLPHGMCNALLLEPVIRYNFEASPCRYQVVARMISDGLQRRPDTGSSGYGINGNISCGELLEMVHRLREQIGLAEGLHAHGLAREMIPVMARTAYLDACLATNPRKPSVMDLEELYEQAL